MFLYDWTAFEVERRVCRLSDANIIRPAVEAGKDSQGPSRSHLAQCVAHCGVTDGDAAAVSSLCPALAWVPGR
jgi:hypothetical protein